MMSTNPYLHFMGNTEEAMAFYKMAFGGKFTIFQRYKDVPGGEKMPAHDQEKLIHVSLETTNGVTIMATDILDTMGHSLTIGNNYHICVNTETEAEADHLFSKLSVGGVVEMPLNKTFWGAYFGMLRDKFGVQWMINHTYPQQ
jgi:PhnB protein